jgi:branched-chain amino acid transport system substrate-binding protein
MLAKAALGLALATAQVQAQTPGVTAPAVKIGGTFPFSGPASALGNTGKGLIAYIKMLNDNGGVNGRKIEYLALDDAYSPPKAVEQMRKLVEQDNVTFIFSALGTASNSATIKYLNNKKIPDAFIVSGAARFAVAADYPYTTTALPSYAAEAAIYAKYVRSEKPGAKVGILFQNDDLGRDFVAGFKSVYGNDYGRLVAAVSYEVADATVTAINIQFGDPTYHLARLAEMTSATRH